MSGETTRKIPLRVSNKKAYVWDVDDIAALRAKHHICGVLVGTLPHLSQQNVFLGVPLVLMPEEVVLLVEKELAVLVDDPNAHQMPTHDMLNTWNGERNSSIQHQLAAVEALGTSEKATKLSMTEEALQKRREREERRAAAARAKALAEGVEPDTESALPPTPVVPDSREQRSSTANASSSHPYLVEIPTASTSFSWYVPESSTYTTIASAKEAGIWDYPSNLHERARCGVFRNLWEKGNFMGGGVRFGGDYLVYPGDPMRYHSHFVATVHDAPTSSLRPMEIVAHGRLGTATKKSHLLCGWDDDKQEVSYFSIEWAGFG